MIKIDWNPPESQLRQFGWISLLGFPAFGLVLHFVSGAPITALYVLIGVGIAVLALSLISTALVRPIFVGLMLVATPIGAIISFVCLSLIYYGLFTPVGILFRITGKDPLEKRLDKAAASYWIVRENKRTPASYFRLY